MKLDQNGLNWSFHSLDKHDLDKHDLDKRGLDKHGLDKHGLRTIRARPDLAYEFHDRTGPDTRICQTGPAGPD